MKFNRIKIYSVVLLTLLVCVAAQAASFTNSDVPPGSSWYVHVNLELIQNSEVGQRLMLDFVDEVLEDIQQKLNLNIRDELEGVTVFGGTLPTNGSPLHEGAVILHGPISAETQAALFSALQDKGAEVATLTDNGQTYYTVADDDHEPDHDAWRRDKELHFSFGNKQALVTQNMELMQSFLDAGGYLGGFENVDSEALLVLQADRALLQGGANTSASIGGNWNSSILKNVNAAAMVIAEDMGDLKISAQLTANSPEVAMSVRNIVEGLVALKALDTSDAAVADVLRSVRFENDGSNLRVEVAVAADQIEVLKDL